MYLQPEKCVCCKTNQNNCFQNIKRACFHKIREILFLAIKHSRHYLTIWERAYYSITCFFSIFNEISQCYCIFVHLILPFPNVPGFGVIDFFASFSQYQQSYLFIFVVVASFLNHKQWSPKFLALGNQGDLSIPGFGEKFIGVEAGGTLELHVEGKLSWTKLQGTIKGFSAISSSFRHKVHVFQIYAGKSRLI